MPSIPSSTPLYDNLPHGLDRADGLSGRIGTPTPTGAISYESAGGAGVDYIPIQELPSSPTMERAEQCTIRKSYIGSYSEMLNRWGIYSRGSLVVDSYGYGYRILNVNISHVAGKGDIGQLDLTMESLSFDNPPDEFGINTVNLGLDLLKNPRYFYNLMPTAQLPANRPSYIVNDNPVQSAVKSTIIRAIQAYRENPLVPPQNVLNNTSGFYHDLILMGVVSGTQVYPVANPNFNPDLTATAPDPIGTKYGIPPVLYPPAASTTPVGTPPKLPDPNPNPPIYYVNFDLKTTTDDPNGKVALAMAAAQEVLTKIWRQEDAPPVYGLELTWAEYYWRPPYLNLGSYIEDPRFATPALPDYFYSPGYIPSVSNTIFDSIASFNPQYYSSTGLLGGQTSISWLRMADTLEFGRTFFKVTRKWLGAPIGCWDSDLFNQNGRPMLPGDYNTVILS